MNTHIFIYIRREDRLTDTYPCTLTPLQTHTHMLAYIYMV